MDDHYPVGTEVTTPSGRRAIILRYLSGYSKRDHFERVLLRYVGGKRRDMVTLQPHQVTKVQIECVEVVEV